MRVEPARATMRALREQTGPMARCDGTWKREQKRHTDRVCRCCRAIRVRRRPVGHVAPGRGVNDAHPAPAGLTRPTIATPRSASKKDRRVKARRRGSAQRGARPAPKGAHSAPADSPKLKARANGTHQLRSGHPARPPTRSANRKQTGHIRAHPGPIPIRGRSAGKGDLSAAIADPCAGKRDPSASKGDRPDSVPFARDSTPADLGGILLGKTAGPLPAQPLAWTPDDHR